jgi:hypothetical protein
MGRGVEVIVGWMDYVISKQPRVLRSTDPNQVGTPRFRDRQLLRGGFAADSLALRCALVATTRRATP